MTRRYLIAVGVAVVLSAAIVGIVVRHRRNIHHQPFTLSGAQLTEFASLGPIDAHSHVFQNRQDSLRTLQRLNMRVLDILYVDDTNPYLKTTEPQRTDVGNFVNASAGRAKLCTTFDPFQFHNKNFSNSVITELNQDFAGGAVAVKIWKNVGMEIRKPSGQYLMPDDSLFEPIYQDIAAHGKTLITHLADPDTAWELPETHGSSTKYYETNPAWDMSKKPDAPKKETILQARDHMLEMNPKLRVIGAHFGSMEDHLDELAASLDKYPNFAVDTAARIRRLIFQPREQVRTFILKYQDRILYGTDLHVYAGNTDPNVSGSWERQYARDWRYLATDDTFEYEGHTIEGLNLPQSVLKKLYHDNAVRWIPGIAGGPAPRK
jgi:predicted TIM-barrel fold metal-dependent hydrolase